MQLLILALALCLFAHDQFPGLVLADRSWPVLLAIVLAPKLVLTGAYALACVVTRRRLTSGDASRRLRRINWMGGGFRLIGIILYATDLHVGLLVAVRGALETRTGLSHTILLDELLVILPTLVYWGLGWWFYYPIERRLREAGLIRLLDQGLPAYPIWTRWQYVGSQFRHQVALILVPLLAILAWAELIQLGGPAGRQWFSPGAEPWLLVGGCFVIFLFAPLMIRLIWDTAPLPDGEIRRHLLVMCKDHRVGVRDLLLWRTHGGMINAAVIGLIAPLRFILITDALLGQMPKPHVEAVMAHELAHVRKRHMLWLLVWAVALMGLVETAGLFALSANGVRLEQTAQALKLTTVGGDPIAVGLSFESLDSPQALVLAVSSAAMAVWVTGFGWVSRRVERQADSFAAAHLARQRGGETIESQDAQTMIDALQHVADLNHIAVAKHSWRHGSIAWRQDYLRSLVGKPMLGLPIDRQMRYINALAVLMVVAVVAMQAYLG